MTVNIIARIRTELPEKFGVPRQSGLVPQLRGTIVFEPAYRNPDALRGIAVAGIILFHAREHFNLYWSGLDYIRAGFGGWEQTVAGALGFLLSGKMYAIFALLFGLSFFIQSDNQAQRGNDFSLRFAWRMILLFGIGLIGIFLTRFFIEFIKTEQEAFEQGWLLDMGQWLSIPFILLGIYMIYRGATQPEVVPVVPKSPAATAKKKKK